MEMLTKKFTDSIPFEDQIFIYWLGGVSYIVKSRSLTVGFDLYLTDSCRNEKDDFKRLIPSLVSAEELKLDFLIATHEHGDHFDVGCIHQIINGGTQTKLIAPGTVISLAKKLGLDQEKLFILDRNNKLAFENIKFAGVLADHGEYSLDAIGIIIELENKAIYFTGDTCYKPDIQKLIHFDRPIDLLIVPINGKFGNPDAKDAAYITAWVKPRIVIPCHYWMFKEHGGDPGEFAEVCPVFAPETKIIIPTIGEQVII